MGEPPQDARPKMQKSGSKSRGNGEDEASSRGEREQQPCPRPRTTYSNEAMNKQWSKRKNGLDISV